MKFNLLKNKEKSQKNKQEKSRGRSMVEMLGVLAIIGVLSIGGISGYTISMRRYRANEIANLMTKYSFMLYQNFQTKMLNDPSFTKLEEFRKLSQSYGYNWQYEQKGAFSTFYSCTGSGSNEYNPHSCLANSLAFSNSGLGSLPSGIRDIEPGFWGIGKDGSSVLALYIYFEPDNQELCKQVNILFGDAYASDNPDDSTCAGSMPYLCNGVVVDSGNYFGHSNDNSYSADW